MEYFKWYELKSRGLINDTYCPKNPYTNDFIEWIGSLKKEVIVSEVYRKHLLAKQEIISKLGKQ